MTLRIELHEPYWDDIKDSVQEIADQFGDYNTNDVEHMLRTGGAYLVLDREHPEEFYIVTINFKQREALVWQGYSKRGAFLKRTLRELELLCADTFGSDAIFFLTKKPHLFDKQIERGVMPGWKKQPVVYKREIVE